MGFAQDERSPHATTLDAIARYLGFAHWDELKDIEGKGNSDFGTTEEEIRSDDFAPNRIVEFAYLPDRLVRLKYLGSHRYLVLESQNSKLQADDEIEVLNFVLHHPLLVLQVWREGKSLGQFTAGRISGLSSITLL